MTATFAYSQVEAVLAQVHGVPDEAMGAFRGRLKHFMRLGIVPSSPGKGKRVAYELKDIMYWAWCLEFSEFGIDPAVIKMLASLSWASVRDAFLAETPPEPDRVFVFHPALLTRGFPQDLPREAQGSLTFGVVTDLSEIDRLAGAAAGRLKARLGMTNLGHLRRAIEAAMSRSCRTD
jgi:hypothetical protein